MNKKANVDLYTAYFLLFTSRRLLFLFTSCHYALPKFFPKTQPSQQISSPNSSLSLNLKFTNFFLKGYLNPRSKVPLLTNLAHYLLQKALIENSISIRRPLSDKTKQKNNVLTTLHHHSRRRRVSNMRIGIISAQTTYYPHLHLQPWCVPFAPSWIIRSCDGAAATTAAATASEAEGRFHWCYSPLMPSTETATVFSSYENTSRGEAPTEKCS